MKKIIGLFSVVTLAFASCTNTKVDVPVKEETCDSIISYANDIVPIVTAKCTGCHSAGFASGDFTSYSVLKAKADNGTLKNRVVTQRDMPEAPNTMSDSARAVIRCWIVQGAPNN